MTLSRWAVRRGERGDSQRRRRRFEEVEGAGRGGYDANVMGQIDEKKERQRLAELYAGMEKGELEEIAGAADSLTAVAREALRAEMLSRGMEAPPANASAAETSASRDEPPSPVVIARYGGVPEALLAKSMLDSAGIESFLGDENLVRLDWFYSNLVGGIKLMVREEDAETARAVLEKNIPEKLEVTGVGEYAQPPCPKCGSLDVSFDELNKQIAYTGFFLGVPIHVNHKGGKCRACGHEWEPRSEAPAQ